MCNSEYEKIDRKVKHLIKRVSLYMGNLNFEYIETEINKAYEYAKMAHEGQYRHSGEPYLIHPVEATDILVYLKPDIYTIQACLLHDVIEDTPKTAEDIREEFGDEVAFLCEGLAKLSKIKYQGEQRDIGSLRKMFIAMAEDLRVIFIKLSDRLHNMKTLKFHPKKEKIERIALETLNIYSPIADRLGLYHLKNRLDQECFKVLEPKEYRKLKRELKTLKPQVDSFVVNIKGLLEKQLEGHISNYQIDFRVKSIYSIHKKLVKKGLEKASDLYDLFGIRIMVENESDCYRALGLIHGKRTPLPKRFKDYIALPKPNGYKSLHTNVIGLFKAHRKQPTEIQIKTYKMKEFSDLGVAAHFEYKEKGSVIANDVYWVKELKEIVASIGDTDFVGSLKVDVFKDRIFVFTPKGESINLPSGSTPIDFAYMVHTELGDHITLAKVNGTVYPLDKELRNGDVVEVVIDKNKKPNPLRMGFLKTFKAKNRIKSLLKQEDRELHRDRGKEIMVKYLEKAGLQKFDKDLSLLKNIDGVVNNLEDRLKILEQVGNFSITPASLIKRILKHYGENLVVDKKADKSERKIEKKENKKSTETKKKNIIIGGEKDLDYKLCYCSRRKIDTDIVAHINNKGEFTIHRRSCKILKDVNKDRLLPAYQEGKENECLLVSIIFIVNDKIGMLKELVDIIYGMGIDTDSINTKKAGHKRTEISIELRINDYDYLVVDRLLDRIKMQLGNNLIDSEIKGMKKY